MPKDAFLSALEKLREQIEEYQTKDDIQKESI
jgi:hypothetical protein